LASTTSAIKQKPSQPDEDAIVELRPPAEFGFSGTAKLLAIEQASMIEELLKRGYTRVDRDRG
jgi:hypothetical protein